MIVQVNSLKYRYPRSKELALHGIDFSISDGEIFGFLGPNGAGKSTTQKILTGILPGYEGKVSVFGKSLEKLGSDYYNHVGVSFEFPNLYSKLTAEENLEFYRRFFDVPTREPKELLKMFDLPVGEKKNAGQFSKGMKMRLTLARSLINRPKLWFLDEPTTGQDPQHSVEIRNLIKKQKAEGTTIFLTTHDMTVAEELCDRVAFIVGGKIAVIDSPRNLRLLHAKKVVRVEYSVRGSVQAEELSLEDTKQKAKFIELVKNEQIETIHTLEPSLEDVFLKVTGRRLI